MRYLCMAFVIYVIGAVRVHECGRTRIQIYAVCMIEIRSSFLFHGFPRFLIPFEFVSWRQCAPLERASSYRVNCIFIWECARKPRLAAGWLPRCCRSATSYNKYCDSAILDNCRFFFLSSFRNDFTSTRHVRLVIVSRKYRWNVAKFATLSFYTKAWSLLHLTNMIRLHSALNTRSGYAFKQTSRISWISIVTLIRRYIIDCSWVFRGEI